MLKITRNPYRLAAVACMLVGIALGFAGLAVLQLLAFGVAVVVAFAGVRTKDRYPR